MNITIKVEAEELIAAINKLAAAVSLNPAVIDHQPVAIKNAPAKKAAKAEAPAPAPETKAITLEQVRAKLAEVSNAGKKNEVKELLTSYGVSKLTDLPAEKYSELLAEAEAL